LKVLDIAGERPRRREFSRRISEDGHEIIRVPGRREALEMLAEIDFDLAVLDAYSDLYDARKLVAEIRTESKGDPVIAVVVEPRSRPPRHRIAGRDPNVVFLQDGSVDHMTKIIALALQVREQGIQDDEGAPIEAEFPPEEGEAALLESSSPEEAQ
jgi:CheY-like chemotaxis protein